MNDHKLARVQDQTISVACPISYLWQSFKNEAELSYKEILKMLRQSLAFLGSINANINSFCRECLSNILSKDFSSLVYDQSIKHGEFLFDTDLAEKIEKQSKEQKLISKIMTDSYPKAPVPIKHSTIQPGHSEHGVGPEVKPNIKESFCQEKVSSKIETKGSIEVSGWEMILLTGCTFFFYDNWESVNASSQVLNIISGYKIHFVKEPDQYHHRMTQVNSDEERVLTEEEINNLLAEDATEEVPMSELCYSSSMFLVAKNQEVKDLF